MEIYKVGGCVRDQLLNLSPKDIDFVVVGSTPEEMKQLDYKQVGSDFPVFLDRGGREFALARVERKTAAGYQGFEVDFDSSVTLEQDLSRRDITINAMAQKVTNFTHHKIRTFKYDDVIIDPFNGQQDLADGVLRHVSKHFADDPVRALRIARFAARYDFSIHPDTIALVQQMEQNGEFDALKNERVWNELQRAIMEKYPQHFFTTLMNTNIMTKILKLSTNDIRLGRLIHSSVCNMPLTIRLLAVGFTNEQIKKLSGPSDVIKFLKVLENFENQHCSFFTTKFNSSNITELMKRFNVNHADSWIGGTLIQLLRFKAVIDNQPFLHNVITKNVLQSIRNIKLAENSDIPTQQRGDHLWALRRELIENIL